MSRIAGAFALALLSTTVARAQATIDDCEKIQAADAYNQCLAKFGPTSKVKSVEPVKPGDVKDSGAEAAASSKPSAFMEKQAARKHGRGGRHGHAVARRRSGKAAAKRGGGRKRMTIIVHRHK